MSISTRWSAAAPFLRSVLRIVAGFMFMLAGGSDASNTDPYAKGPEPGNHWISTGAHIMVVGPAVKTMPGYPKGADPVTSKPYVAGPRTSI